MMAGDAPQAGPKTGRRQSLYLVALLLITWGLFATSLNTQLNPDGILYSSYLRSAFFDRDVLLVNEFNAMELLPLSRHVSATGLEGNPVAIGTPLLMAPFYALAFLADRLAGKAGFDLGDEGYRGVYAYVFPVGSMCYGCLTGLMILAMIRRRSGPRYAGLSLLHVMLGSPFLFYLAVHFQVSHLCSAFSVTLLLYTLENIRRSSDLADRRASFFILGAIGGLAVLVRTQNGLFWIIPCGFLVSRLWRHGRFRDFLAQGIAFLAGAATAVSPQLTLWKLLHGRWIHAPEAANIDVSNLHFLEMLTSSYHGLFVWSPVLAISLAGLVWLARHDPDRGIPMLLAVLLQVFISASMRMWWQGGAFGLRLLVNCTPIFCIGLAFVYSRIKAPWIRLLGGLLVAWTALLYLNVITDRIDLNRFYPFRELFLIQAGQFLNLFNFRAVEGGWKIYRFPAGAGILTAGVAVTTMALFWYGRRVAADLRRVFFSVYGVIGTIAMGIGISLLIWLLGLTSQAHKSFWQEDLARLESGLNSYSLFYIDYSFYIMHGDYLVAVGRWPEAADAYKKAIDIHATPPLYGRLVEVLMSAGRYPEAEAVMAQALDRWPDDSRLLERARDMGRRRP